MVKVVFYGDDFTGATDNCAQYHRHGLKSLLFFSAPGEAVLREAAARYDVIGVAGTARSMATDAMAGELLPILDGLVRLGAPIMQYKCCSTFDSSPSVGSLGEAVRLMRSRWPDSFVAVLAATPEFGRYTAFGHHFARFDDEIFRLDRHPVMVRHPVTPMHESDLGRILAQQGFTPERLVDLRELERYTARPEHLAQALLAGTGSAVFDGFSDAQVTTAAAAIWHLGQQRSVTAIAAQGLAHALGQYFRQQGMVDTPPPPHRLAPVDRLLVLSGSCSSVSAAQIEWARQAGFSAMRLTPSALADPACTELRALEEELIGQLQRGRSVIAYSASGPDDPAIAALRKLLGDGVSPSVLADRIGAVYARLMRKAIERAGLRRFVIAGGDSSSFAMRHLGARALQINASHFAQNAHVCGIQADDASVDGIEVLLKGGQVGTADLYGLMLKGF